MFFLTFAVNDAEMYVHSNIIRLTKMQEQRFGMAYKELPIVVIGFPTELSTTSPGNKSTIHGVFSNNIIYLKKLPVLLPGHTLRNIVLYLLTWGNVYDIEQLLHHELVHFYFRNTTFNSLVGEGIAEYIAREMVNNTIILSNWQNVTRTKLVSIVAEPLYYEIAYAVVKPIVDNHGKTGIIYVLNHPPAENEELLDYQKRMMKEVAR